MRRGPVFASLVLLLGVALPAAGAVPPSRYVIANGTVYDTLTKLTWQQTIVTDERTYGDAASYCDGLPLDGGNWRLPKVSELLSIADRTRFDPAIDTEIFEPQLGRYFWTSTAYSSRSGDMWLVYFYDGSSTHDAVDGSHSIRCVR